MRRLATILALALLILGALAAPLHAQAQRKKYDTGWWWTFGPGGGGSNPAVVQAHIAVGSFSTSTTIAFSSNVTSGNVLVAWAFGGGTVTGWNAATGSGTGCGSTTFTLQGSPGSGAQSISTGTASGTGPCTITVSGTGMADITGAAYEISNATLTGFAISTYTTPVCTACTGSSVTSGSANNMILTFVGVNGGPYSSPSPFTFDVNGTDALGFQIGAGSYLQAAAGSYTPTWMNSRFIGMNVVSVAIP